MKLALCVGVNVYPNPENNLQGCVNDMNDITERLVDNGWHVEQLQDSNATISNIKAVLNDFANTSKNFYFSGKSTVSKVFWSDSSHGTDTIDVNGDEITGRDQALYVYDGVWKDDNIGVTLDQFPKEIDLGVLFDSCFSGTGTRKKSTEYLKARYVKTSTIPIYLPLRKSVLTTLPWWYYSGCGNREYSYDAYINGRYNGAMTRAWINSLELNKFHIQIYEDVRSVLPSDKYPQTPGLEGNYENKILLDVVVTDIPDIPNEENPEPIKLTFWQRIWKAIKRFFGYK